MVRFAQPGFQPAGQIDRNGGMPMQDTRKRHTAHAQLARGFCHGQSKRGQDVFPQRFAWMGGLCIRILFS